MSTFLVSRPQPRPHTVHTQWSHYGWLVCAFFMVTSWSLFVTRDITTFGVYRSSGIAATQGTNPFAVLDGTTQTFIVFEGKPLFVKNVNLNPPCVLPFFQLLSRLSYRQFSVLWTLGSLFFLFASTALLVWDRSETTRFQLVWLWLATPVLETLSAGQIYFFLMFLSTLVLLLAKRDRDVSASVPLGLLVAIKPIFIFWPVFLFLSRRRRLALHSFVVSAVVSLVPLMVYGRTIYTQWLATARNDMHWMVPLNIAIMAQFRRLGFERTGVLIALAVAAGLAYLVWTRRPSFEITSAIALCAVILCSPLAWYDYCVVLAPLFVSHRWSKPETVAAVLLMIEMPTLIVMCAMHPVPVMMAYTIMGSEAFVAVCIILGCYIRSVERQKPADSTDKRVRATAAAA